MEDLIDTCHYGVDRAQCHVGCGRWCRPARRAALRDILPASSMHPGVIAARESLSRPVPGAEGFALKTGGDGGSIADYPIVTFTAHPACGTADCCGTCQTVSIPNTEETT